MISYDFLQLDTEKLLLYIFNHEFYITCNNIKELNFWKEFFKIKLPDLEHDNLIQKNPDFPALLFVLKYTHTIDGGDYVKRYGKSYFRNYINNAEEQIGALESLCQVHQDVFSIKNVDELIQNDEINKTELYKQKLLK